MLWADVHADANGPEQLPDKFARHLHVISNASRIHVRSCMLDRISPVDKDQHARSVSDLTNLVENVPERDRSIAFLMNPFPTVQENPLAQHFHTMGKRENYLSSIVRAR
jgi:hypothetical protein